MVRSYQPDAIMDNRLGASRTSSVLSRSSCLRASKTRAAEISLNSIGSDVPTQFISRIRSTQFLRSLLNNDKDQRAWLPGLFFTFV